MKKKFSLKEWLKKEPSRTLLNDLWFKTIESGYRVIEDNKGYQYLTLGFDLIGVRIPELDIIICLHEKEFMELIEKDKISFMEKRGKINHVLRYKFLGAF